jgi:Na+/H+-dicarboxylate symporter
MRSATSLTGWSIGALLAGLALGWLGHTVGQGPETTLARALDPLGALWLAALQATVLPLVIVQMIAAVAGTGDQPHMGRLGTRALALFLGLLVAVGVFTVATAPVLIGQFRFDPASVSALSATVAIPESARAAAVQPSAIGSVGDWIAGLIPSNVFRALVGGEILPLLLVSLLFGAALRRVPDEPRRPVVLAVLGIADALLVLVRWLLWFTPIGVFAFAYRAALGVGGMAAGMLGAYTLVVCVLLIVVALLFYPLATGLGRVPLRTFARALAPAQLVAVGTRSSIASLPALVAGARDTLRLPESATGFVLPLCTSMFKVNRTVSSTAKLLFLASVYGVSLDAWTMASFLAVVVALSFASVGLPGGGSAFKTLPAYLAAGIPIEGVVLAEAVEAVPDVFKTLLNVTANMSVAVLLTPPVAREG